ncbi:MAG: 50S ribosomal protein L19 [Rickettsiales bacterium]|nr:MAG: 50S ribosomal protein L19 [Rickettsiales bacterium]
MTNIVHQFEKDQIAKMTENKEIPEFRAGDTVKVSVKVIDGANTRLQAYEGVVISKRNRAITSSFVVRKVSHGEGVERRFMTYSPIVAKIEVVKRGIVRRAKLHYLRALSGRAARIQERKYVKK